MESILLIAHGSKRLGYNHEINQLLLTIKRILKQEEISICYLEYDRPTIQEAITHLVAKGCTKIIAIPLLLVDACHAQKDIPNEIEKAKMKFPQISFIYGKPIGIHDKIYNLLIDRLIETKYEIDTKTAVILVAKGSQIESANKVVHTISQEFEKFCNTRNVKAAFLSMAKPKLKEVIDECISEGATKIIILPYLLFRGLLLDKITKIASECKIKNPDHSIIVCNLIGSHSLLNEIIIDRIEEARKEKRDVHV